MGGFLPLRWTHQARAGGRGRTAYRSRVPAECREAKPNETRAGTQRNMVCRLRSGVSPLGPGSRCARPGHERAKSRRVQSGPLAVIPDSRCQTAQSCSFPRHTLLRPGFVLVIASIPEWRGGRSADRRTISVVALVRRDWSAPSGVRRVP